MSQGTLQLFQRIIRKLSYFPVYIKLNRKLLSKNGRKFIRTYGVLGFLCAFSYSVKSRKKSKFE